MEPLKGYQGEDIEIQLPRSLTMHSIDWLAVWCVQYTHNFGHVNVPDDLDVPPALGQTKLTVSSSRFGGRGSGGPVTVGPTKKPRRQQSWSPPPPPSIFGSYPHSGREVMSSIPAWYPSDYYFRILWHSIRLYVLRGSVSQPFWPHGTLSQPFDIQRHTWHSDNMFTINILHYISWPTYHGGLTIHQCAIG